MISSNRSSSSLLPTYIVRKTTRMAFCSKESGKNILLILSLVSVLGTITILYNLPSNKQFVETNEKNLFFPNDPSNNHNKLNLHQPNHQHQGPKNPATKRPNRPKPNRTQLNNVVKNDSVNDNRRERVKEV